MDENIVCALKVALEWAVQQFISTVIGVSLSCFDCPGVLRKSLWKGSSVQAAGVTHRKPYFRLIRGSHVGLPAPVITLSQL